MAQQPPIGPRWRGNGPAAAGPGRTQSSGAAPKVRSFVVLALLLAIAGAVTAWLFYMQPPPEPYLLTLPIREYAARQWPVNFFAVQDSELLLQHFKEDRRKKAYD